MLRWHGGGWLRELGQMSVDWIDIQMYRDGTPQESLEICGQMPELPLLGDGELGEVLTLVDAYY